VPSHPGDSEWFGGIILCSPIFKYPPDIEEVKFILLKRRSFKLGIIQHKLYWEDLRGLLLYISNKISMKRSFNTSLFQPTYETVMVFLIHSKIPVIKLLQQGDEDQVQVHSQEYQTKAKFAYVRSVRDGDLQVGYLTLEWCAPRPDRDRRRKSIKLWMSPLSRSASHQGRHPSPSHSIWRRRIWDPGKRDVFEIFFCIYDSSWS